MNKITIFCKNNHRFYDIDCGTSLFDLYHQIGLELKFTPVAARVNYKLQNLNQLKKKENEK